MDEWTAIKWKPTGVSEAIRAEMLVVDAREIRDEWMAASRLPEPRRTRRSAELYFLMEIFATFPRTTVARSRPLSVVDGELRPRPSAAASEARTAPESAPETPSRLTGKYHGAAPTDTERAAGEQIEVERYGPIRKDGPRHQLLREFEFGERLTAYDASLRARGHEDVIRREARRLFDSGYLAKDGTAQNPRDGGKIVDAYRITEAGKTELRRLREEAAAA